MHNLTIAISVIGIGYLVSSAVAHGDPPALKTEGTVIYLADNLDEADNLGWCIDTVGRGFAEELHAHSCKPQGGDVQFGFDDQTGLIPSVEFSGKCMSLIDANHPSVPFGLVDCDATDQNQIFEFSDGFIRISSDPSLCVAAGPASRSAGPFMSRDLTLVTCEDVPSELATWSYNQAN